MTVFALKPNKVLKCSTGLEFIGHLLEVDAAGESERSNQRQV
ncbi:hypothetical protein PMIT1313_00233 [Prochlorococcus marinus str. MIT 1313]|nr:hypothetical protein PMIT1313_00233 [Prochlorococcus marinus str. MIT 1313]KZR76928.1 hypothetical protein PMIT1318_00135 [Prochlorococcus marinus str. MIT 1318]